MNRFFERQVRLIRWIVVVLIIIILVFLPVFSPELGAIEYSLNTRPSTMLNFTNADNGKSVDVQINDILIVSLKENPTTGFQWAIDGKSDDLVKLQASEYIPASGLIGSGGQKVYTFKTLRAGTTQLRLKRWREWQGASSIIERFALTIRVRA